MPLRSTVLSALAVLALLTACAHTPSAVERHLGLDGSQDQHAVPQVDAALLAALEAVEGRDYVRSPRPRQEVIRFLEDCDKLFEAMGPSERALRRFGEVYAELRARALLDAQTGAAEENRKLAARASERSLYYYGQLFSTQPGYPSMDEALYYSAIESVFAGRLDHAQKTLGLLNQKYGTSRFAPLAHYVSGEILASAAVSDPSQWNLASAAFAQSLQHVPPENPVYCFALERRAEILVKQNDREEAAQLAGTALICAKAQPGQRQAAVAIDRASATLRRLGFDPSSIKLGEYPVAARVEPGATKAEAQASFPARPVLPSVSLLDTRPAPRARGLLLAELQGLERLLRATQRKAPDRVSLMRRLAEAYGELRAAAARDASDPAKANEASKVARAASSKAESYYQRLLEEYPSYMKADEVRFYTALGRGHAGDDQGMKEQLIELIEQHAGSEFVPQAYVLLGDALARDTGGKPGAMDGPEDSYSRAIGVPPWRNPALCLAEQRSAELAAKSKNRDRAIYHAREALTCVTEFDGQRGADYVRSNAPATLKTLGVDWTSTTGITPAAKNPMTAGQKERRTALVIGNGKYTGAALPGAGKDAELVARALERAGFKVTLKLDSPAGEMKSAIKAFGRGLEKGGTGLFFFAGHALQLENQNYLVPVDAELSRRADTRAASVPFDVVLETLARADNRANLVVLDVCRSTPFSTERPAPVLGLSLVDTPEGTLTAYCQAPGIAGADQADGVSDFANWLAGRIAEPGLEVTSLFASAERVWWWSTLAGPFHFVPPAP
jgi:hypothetical protein